MVEGKYGGQAYRFGGTVTNVMRDKAAPAYRLDDDSYRGFKTSVTNGQVRLALEYASLIITEQHDAIEKLKAELAEAKSMFMDVARTAEKRGPGRPPKAASDATQGTSDLAE